MPKIVQLIGCYYANQSGRSPAPLFVTYETAKEMVDARLAVWNKKATYINLTKTQAGITPTAPSLKMGEDIMFLNACGDVAAMALVDGWQPLMRAA